jgi:hypothetical protein
LIDRNWESNIDEYTPTGYQIFDFEQYFDMLIKVKDGYYSTDFEKANKNLQRSKRKYIK